jgi:hypothetical protein
MAAASLRPSMEPGIWISVKKTVMSKRLSSMRTSSAFSFDYIEAGGSNHIDRVHAGQELVFHDQDDGLLCF